MVNTILMFNSIVAAATFFLLPTLGEIYAERSGILNLGIEGMIIASAAFSYAIAYSTQNVWLGVLFGMLLGAVLSAIHAIVSITFTRTQVVSGIGLTILGTGLSGILGRGVVGKAIDTLENVNIPILSEIPYIGEIFFEHPIIVYISYLLVPICWFILYKTRIGILIRSVGENPEAAYNQGINVNLIRYLCVIFGGMMSGLGGAYLSLGYLNFWSEGITQGRGWIVIALVVVALWNPLGAFLGSYVFGAFDVMQYYFQLLLPTPVLKMAPHLSTILFLAIWGIILSGKKVKSIVGAPTALAVPFEKS